MDGEEKEMPRQRQRSVSRKADYINTCRLSMQNTDVSDYSLLSWKKYSGMKNISDMLLVGKSGYQYQMIHL